MSLLGILLTLKSTFILCYLFIESIKVVQGQCLIQDKAHPDLCSVCKFGFYSTSGPTLFTTLTSTNSSFPISECLPVFATPGARVYFVTASNRSCGGLKPCSGSQTDPFNSIIYAFESLALAVYKYELVDVTIHLLTSTHYVITAPNEIYERILLRRTNINLVFKPAFCSEVGNIDGCFQSPTDKVTVYIKTTKFRLFATHNIKIINTVFKGNDLHYYERFRNKDLQSIPDCLSKLTSCCDDSAFNATGGIGCGLFSEEVTMNIDFSEATMPIFIIEPFLELNEIASLSFENCEFRNFFLYTLFSNAIIGYMPEGYFKLNISGGTLEGSLILGGFIAANSINILEIYREDGYFMDYKQRTANLLATVELTGFRFEKINKYLMKAFYYSQFKYRGFLSVRSFRGGLRIIKCIFIEAKMSFSKAVSTSTPTANLLYGTLLVFDGLEGYGVAATVTIDSTEFIDNEADYLIYVNSLTNIILTNITFTRNSGPFFNILIKDSDCTFKGISMNGTLAQSGFLTFSNTRLLVSELNAAYLRPPTSIYSLSILFKDTSSIAATLETIFATTAVKSKYCSSVLNIFNVTILKSRVLLVDSMNCIHNLTVKGCFLLNTPYMEQGETIKESLNMINAVCEMECNFTNFSLKAVVFDNFNLILVGGARTHILSGFRVEDSILSFISWTRQVLLYNQALTSDIAEIYMRNYTNAGYYVFNYDYVATGQGFSVRVKNIEIQGIFFKVTDNGVFNLRVARAEIVNVYLKEISTANFINFRGSIVNPDFILNNITFLVMENSFSFIIITASETIKNFSLKNSIFDCRKPLLVVTALNIIKTTIAEIYNLTIKNIITEGASAFSIGVDVNNFLIRNCSFINNSAKNYGADLNILSAPGSLNVSYFPFIGILECLFSNSFGSGSINIEKQTSINIENSTFFNISSQIEGAAVKFSTQTSGVFKNVLFKNMQSTISGGCLYLRGTNLTLINITIIKSASKTYGGAIFAQQSFVYITKCEFHYGSAAVGGFLYLDQTLTEINKSLFNISDARSKGGHIYTKGMSLKITETTLKAGSAESFGTSLYLESTFLFTSDSLIENCVAKQQKGKGIGTIYMIGQRNSTNVFVNFSCINNIAMTAACLYAKDAEVVLQNKSMFVNNTAIDNSVIETMSSYITSRLLMGNISFINNNVKEAVLNIKKTYLSLWNCTFDSLFSPTFIAIENSKAEINSSIFKTSNSLPNSGSALGNYQIKAKKIDINEPLLLSNINFLCGAASQAISCHECEIVQIKNVRISNTSLQSEAIYFSECQSVFFMKSSIILAKGGAVRAEDTNVTIINSSFLSAEQYGLLMIRLNEFDTMLVTIQDSEFRENKGQNIISKKIDFVIENSFLYGLSNFPSLGLQLLQITSARIFSCLFMNFFQMGAVIIDQPSATVSEILMVNNLFANSSNLMSGGFISITSSVRVSISNCSFLNGSTNESGGAIYYDCAITTCTLTTDSLSVFKLNRAQKTGGAIKAVASLPQIDPKTTFYMNYANDITQDLSSFGFEFLVILDVEDSTTLRNVSNNLEIKELKKLTVKKINMFSGYKLRFCLLLMDHYQNILLEQSDKLVEINGENSKEVFLERNIERLSQGIVCFKGLIITAKPGRLFNVTIKYEGIIQNLEVESRFCPRGDIYRDLKCVTCEENYFSLDSNSSDTENGRNATDVCQPCQENAICRGADSMWPEAGFWILNENSSLVVKCTISDACLGFNSSKEYFKGDKCNFGYRGNICSNCITDFSKNAFGECIPCNFKTHIIFFLKLIVACGFMFLDNINLLEIGQVSALEKERRPLMKILVFHVGYLTIITQTSMNLGDVVQDAFKVFKSYLSIIPDDFIKFECFFEGSSKEELFQANLIIVTLTPIIYTFFVFIISYSHIVIIKRLLIAWPNSKSLAKLNVNAIWTSPKGLITMAICILIISVRNFYTKVLLTTFKLFHCIKIGEGLGQFLEVDPDVECWGDKHKRVFFSIFFPNIAIWGLGLPFLFYRVSRKGQRKVYKAKGGESIIESSVNTIITIEPAIKDRSSSDLNVKKVQHSQLNKHAKSAKSHNSPSETIKDAHEDDMALSRNVISVELVPMIYLSEDYERRFYFWESLIFLNLFILSLLSQALSSFDDLSQGVIMIVMFTGVFFLNLRLSPYRDVFIKKISIFSSIVTVTTSLLSTVASRNTDNDILRYGAISILGLINLMFYIIWILIYLRTYKDVRNNRRIKTLISIVENRFAAFSRQVKILLKSK